MMSSGRIDEGWTGTMNAEAPGNIEEQNTFAVQVQGFLMVAAQGDKVMKKARGIHLPGTEFYSWEVMV